MTTWPPFSSKAVSSLRSAVSKLGARVARAGEDEHARAPAAQGAHAFELAFGATFGRRHRDDESRVFGAADDAGRHGREVGVGDVAHDESDGRRRAFGDGLCGEVSDVAEALGGDEDALTEASSLTLRVLPLIDREAVARETPASRATSCRVAGWVRTVSVIASLLVESVGMASPACDLTVR